MITNLIATILITVVTNIYAPKQYWHYNNTILCTVGNNSQSAQSDNSYWDDDRPFMPNWGIFPSQPTERDNPDIRITEIRETRTLSFEFEGKTYSTELHNIILSTKKQRRIVTTEERWEEEK